MAKNAIADFDIVPSNNTDIGGIDIRGTASVQNFDDALRTLMAYQKVDYDKTSTFMRTVLDDTDAAAVRATLGVTGYRRLQEVDCAAVPTTTVVVDLADDVNRFRVEFDGIGTASGDALVFMRCGIAGAAADAGSGDYFQQLLNGQDASVVTGGDASSYAPISTVGSNGFGSIIAEGHAGSATTGWAVQSFGRTSYSAGNQITMRGSVRQAVGIRRRLVIQSNVALTKGKILIEVKS